MTAARRKVQSALRSQRRRARAWLTRHLRLTRLLERLGCLHVDELTLARGMAVGLFVGLTPTVGIQTLLMLILAALLRANFAAAFMVSFVSNPLTMAPLYFGFHQLGLLVMTWMPLRFESLSGVEEDIALETSALLLGSLCIAIPAGIGGYFAFLYVWRRLDLHLPNPVDEEEAGQGG